MDLSDRNAENRVLDATGTCEIPDGYREVRCYESIQHGDMYFSNETKTWKEVRPAVIGRSKPLAQIVIRPTSADHRQPSSDTVEPLVLPNRFRLAVAALMLGVITIFDPRIMQGMLIAWHLSNRPENKRWKDRILYGYNATLQENLEAQRKETP